MDGIAMVTLEVGPKTSVTMKPIRTQEKWKHSRKLRTTSPLLEETGWVSKANIIICKSLAGVFLQCPQYVPRPEE